MSENIVQVSPTTFVAPTSGRIYSLKGSVRQAPRAVNVVSQTYRSGEVIPWGTGNNFPEKVVKEVRKNTIIPTVLERLASFVNNGNFDFGYIKRDKDGNPIYESRMNVDKEVTAWLNNTSINRYLHSAATDIVWFANAFPQLTRTNNGAKIASIRATPARKCRWGWPSDEDGLVETCYISGNWAQGGHDKRALPVIDPYYYPVESLRMTAGTNFMYPLSYPDPDSEYYALASWNSVITSGWLEIATKVADLNKAIYNNQMSPKYSVFIAEWYMVWKYDGYAGFTAEQRIAALRDTVNFIEKELSGSDNAGKTISSITRLDDKGNVVKPWEIVPIESPFKDGMLKQDSQEASSHILTALGYDATLTGNGPGKQFGSGSGSDKSVAFNIVMESYVKARQDFILQPLNFIRDYNQWDSDLRFWFWNPSFVKVANNSTTKQE